MSGPAIAGYQILNLQLLAKVGGLSSVMDQQLDNWRPRISGVKKEGAGCFMVSFIEDGGGLQVSSTVIWYQVVTNSSSLLQRTAQRTRAELGPNSVCRQR